VREPLVVLNEKLKVVYANQSYYQSFQGDPAETIGFPFFTISQNQWDIPDLLKLLDQIKLEGNSIEGFNVEKDFNNKGRRRLVLNARKIIRGVEKESLILLAFEEIP
jgi:hypothetical protein